MASKPAPKPAFKKSAPVRGMRTATHKATATPAPSVDKKWQAQEDLHHLKHAAIVKQDPTRHKAAQAEATAQMKALASVTKK